jgi:coenzyme F420-dependent glucose-6-phosphate dehydrogenase
MTGLSSSYSRIQTMHFSQNELALGIPAATRWHRSCDPETRRSAPFGLAFRVDQMRIRRTTVDRCHRQCEMISMTRLGYALSSEEFRPNDLVRNAADAERAGFTFALISDHFHPWMESQGQSPFVWSTLGGIAQATRSLRVGTGVTCPLIRVHPVIVAQAAASVADMFEGRFFLGVGTGEALNEHVTGRHWPPLSVRQEMLEDAVALIRELWAGDYVTRHGRFFIVENAKLYTLPRQPVEICVAASGEDSAKLAAKIGDGLISTAPKAAIVQAFGPNDRRPRYGQMTVCWGPDKAQAVELARKMWGYTALPGQLSQELAIPAYFDEAASIVTGEMVAKSIVCGPDPEPYRAQIEEYAKAGFTHIYLHQVGPDQAGFFAFAEQELLPNYPS